MNMRQAARDDPHADCIRGQGRTAVTPRNAANAGAQYATRKLPNTVTAAGGIGMRLASVTRASDDALFGKLITSNSSLGRNQVIVGSLDRLDTRQAARERERIVLEHSIELLQAAREKGTSSRQSVAAIYFIRPLWAFLIEDPAKVGNGRRTPCAPI